MSYLFHSVAVAALLAVSGCSDYATFVTGTSIGITANANTEQLQIGYARAELFQGPAYPDVGEVLPVVGFLGSDLAVFSPHVRQLYATGDAARLVTMPDRPRGCPSDGSLLASGQPTLCAEKTEDLAGERRPLVFGTGSSVGLSLGFTGNVPSSIKLGYDRQELSIIPFHAQPPVAGTKQPDKYSSALASLNLNVTAPDQLGSGLQMTQFFATGAAARNLAKLDQIRNYFADTAGKAVAVVGAYEPDDNSKCIRDWRGSPADPAKIKLITRARASARIWAVFSTALSSLRNAQILSRITLSIVRDYDGDTEMPQLPQQITPDVPENLLATKLRDDWLPNDPKPRSIQMVRQSNGKWIVTRTYD